MVLVLYRKKKIVKRVFRKVGLSFPIDGSEDNELDIKSLTGIEVGDWSIELETVENGDQFADMREDCDEAAEFVAYREYS